MLILRWASFLSSSRLLFRDVSEPRGPLTEAGEEVVRGGVWEVGAGRVLEWFTWVAEWVAPWAMWTVFEGL